jgi:DNA-binding NarL/FixJ family response regulator
MLESLSFLIRGVENFELCTTSSTAVHIIDDCRQACPDVILMDIEIPLMSGIEATRLVKTAFPEVNVMMLTIFEDKEKIFDALCAGATGYLLKKTPATKIIEAIEELHHGGSPMTGGIARKALEYFTNPKSRDKQEDYQLSQRELDILQHLVKGRSYKMVADACCISIDTVSTHINHIYKKLQVNSKSEAVIKAIKEQLA